MKILITAEDAEERCKLVLSDEMLDNNNYVQLELMGNEVDVVVDELYAAVKAFIVKRDEVRKRDNT